MVMGLKHISNIKFSRFIAFDIRPLVALYPPPHISIFLTDTIERGVNAVDMSIPIPESTESGDQEQSLRLQPYKE